MIRKIICSIAAIWIPSNSWSTEIRNLKVNFANILLRNCFCFFCLIPKYSAIKFRFTFDSLLEHSAPKLHFGMPSIYFLIFVFSTRERSPLPPCTPVPLMRRFRNYFRWNLISPVSVVSHPAPNSTLQGSKLLRLSVIVNRSMCMIVSMRVWAVCDCTSFASLTIDRLNSSSTAAAWAICDKRFTIYTPDNRSNRNNNNSPPSQRMCVCVHLIPTY